MEAAWERKRLKYADLAREAGWRTTIYPLEVGCRGFVGTSAVQLMRDLRVAGGSLQKALKDLPWEVEKSSFCFWLKRMDICWGIT